MKFIFSKSNTTFFLNRYFELVFLSHITKKTPLIQGDNEVYSWLWSIELVIGSDTASMLVPGI